MKKKKILVYGWFGENNLGDELLLSSMIHLIKNNVNNCEINVIGSKPKEIKKNHQDINCVSGTIRFDIISIIKNILNNPFKTIYNIFATDTFIVAGGGAISDWNPSSTRDMFSLINIFSKLKKKIYLLGVGAGPIKKKESYLYFKNVLEKAEVITVRDKYSLNELNKIGVKNVKLTNDLVFNYPIQASPIKQKTKKIGFVLAPVCMDNKNKFLKFVDEIKKVIESLKKEYEVSIIFFQSNYDYILKEYFKNVSDIKIYEEKNNFWNLINIINNQDLIVGMRFHSIVLGLMMNKYIIPIIYHPKNYELIKEFDLEKYASYIGDGSNWEDTNIDSCNILKYIKEIQKDKSYFKKINTIINKKNKNTCEIDILKKI